ncbi:MAG: hypothetical protein K6E33_04980 [Lachnospiraceae bacterium]|nr:hypothetical protein [Lachnospiraceae bacterium]
MKKKGLCILIAGTALFAAACGQGNAVNNGDAAGNASSQAAVERTTSAPAESSATETVAETETQNAQMGNPWSEVTREEAEEACPRLFVAPEGSSDEVWSVMTPSAEDTEAGRGPLVQLTFKMPEGDSFTARAQYGAGADEDISGMYYDWDVNDDITLSNWGEGNMKGKCMAYSGDDESAQLCTWYDIEIGIAYSLGVSGKDLDGLDIQGVAEAMYDGESESDFMPSDFLQEEAQKDEFESFDQVISYLKKGQGYAYLTVTGSEDEVLAITDKVSEKDKTAHSVYIYAKRDGKVQNIGNILGSGDEDSWPVRCADGIIYSGDDTCYESWFIGEAPNGVMMKDSVNVYAENGQNEYVGFLRESNDFDHDKDFTGGEEEFNALIKERDTKAPVEMTVVE